MRYIQSYFTDRGTTRPTNQDGVLLAKAETDAGEVLLAAVCDGMGGHAMGELASAHCIRKLDRWFSRSLPEIAARGGNMIDAAASSLARLAEECNRELYEYGRRGGIGLGSTMTAFVFAGGRYGAVQVGDSRGIVIFKKNALQITEDQSLVADEARRGIITAEEARRDRRRNVLLSASGSRRTCIRRCIREMQRPARRICFALTASGAGSASTTTCGI